MKLTDRQRAALIAVITAKLELWRTATEAEKLLDMDIDTMGNSLEGYCVGVGDPEDAEDLEDDELCEIFDLETVTDDERSYGPRR